MRGYLGRYGLVLVTNYREFVLVEANPDGTAHHLERYTLAANDAQFWTTPIRTLRFPSNWHLSESRAQAVRDMLVAAGVPRVRVRAEGRADAEPVAPNDTPANRALNRRVEITLHAAAVARPAGAAPAPR